MPRELTRRRRPISDDKYDPTPDESGDIGNYEEDEAPRGRGSRRGAAAPSGRRGRVHSEPEEGTEEDEAPRGRGRRSSNDDEDNKPKAKPGKGWGDFGKQASESSDFADNLKIEPGVTSLIKFIDDGPFAVYKQHWIERKGKKSFNCLGEGSCPLCDTLGDKPRLQAAFNVIEFPEEGDPKVVIWTVGVKVAKQLEGLAKESRTKPINRMDLYWAVSKSGKGSSTTYSIQAVKERDLEEDWETQPLTEDEFDEFDAKAYDESEIHYSSKATLREVADEALDD